MTALRGGPDAREMQVLAMGAPACAVAPAFTPGHTTSRLTAQPLARPPPRCEREQITYLHLHLGILSLGGSRFGANSVILARCLRTPENARSGRGDGTRGTTSSGQHYAQDAFLWYSVVAETEVPSTFVPGERLDAASERYQASYDTKFSR